MKHNLHCGFTLLEVLVALTIVALTLGTLMSLLTGSKQLAFKAAEDIGQTIFLRSALNTTQLLEKPDYPEVPTHYKKAFDLKIGDVLEPPKRQTQEIQLGLETYTLINEETGLEMTGLRWKKLEVSQ